MKTSRMLLGLLTVAAAAGAPFAAAAPAVAQTKTVTDPRGDARPYVDVVRATFTNTGTRVAARARVADLRWRGEFNLALYTADPEEGYFLVTVRPKADHTVRTTYGIMSRGGFSRGHCDGGVTTRFRPDADILRIDVRRSCVPQIHRHPMIDFELASLSLSGPDSPRGSDDVRQRVYHQ